MRRLPILLIITLILVSLIFSCSDKAQSLKEVENVDRKWWKEGVLYQIYPQSFKDTDGDGLGDFQGVIEKLDYIESLGISMVWMNPFFESPLVDNGYDVANYRAIHPRYGSMNDFEEMLNGWWPAEKGKPPPYPAPHLHPYE